MSPPYGWWFCLSSRLPLQEQSLQVCRLGSLNGLGFCHVDLFCAGVAFVNGCTSSGVRGSSRHDDSPRVGVSLGRLTHASTSPVKNASTSPDPGCSHLQAAAHCTIVVAYIPLLYIVLMYISFGIVHCMHLVHKLTTLYTTQSISTFFYSEVIKSKKPG